jgi:hypothetical protein
MVLLGLDVRTGHLITFVPFSGSANPHMNRRKITLSDTILFV